MQRRVATVVLMCGLPGSGKSTYAQGLIDAGYVRLSLDEVIWRRLGSRDAGRVLDQIEFDALKEQVRGDQRQELIELMSTGRDVVIDYTFWSKAAREDYKALIERHSCRWKLIYMKVDYQTVHARLGTRNAVAGANSVTVSPDLLHSYLAKFQEPHDEGEQVVDAGRYSERACWPNG